MMRGIKFKKALPMELHPLMKTVAVLAPIAAMLPLALGIAFRRVSTDTLWRLFQALAGMALATAAVLAWAGPAGIVLPAGLQASALGLVLALLVQLLGTVIGSFSSRYLQGEPGQLALGALALRHVADQNQQTSGSGIR